MPTNNPVQKKIHQPLSKRVKILIIVFLFFLILLISLVVISRKPKLTTINPNQILSPTTTIVVNPNPSAYATDSAVLKIEKDLEELDDKIQSLDLLEPSLNPPELDLNVKF